MNFNVLNLFIFQETELRKSCLAVDPVRVILLYLRLFETVVSKA